MIFWMIGLGWGQEYLHIEKVNSHLQQAVPGLQKCLLANPLADGSVKMIVHIQQTGRIKIHQSSVTGPWYTCWQEHLRQSALAAHPEKLMKVEWKLISKQNKLYAVQGVREIPRTFVLPGLYITPENASKVLSLIQPRGE